MSCATSPDMCQAILRSYPAGLVFLRDRDLRLILVDGRAMRAAGMDPEGMMGKLVADAWPTETVAMVPPQLHAALGGQESAQEIPFVAGAGAFGCCRSRTNMVRTPGPSPMHAM